MTRDVPPAPKSPRKGASSVSGPNRGECNWHLRARWCRTTRWPLMAHYARCPYCQLMIEPQMHPDWEYGCADAGHPEHIRAEYVGEVGHDPD